MRKFVFLAAAATAFAFVAPSLAQAQIVIRAGSPTPYFGGYSSGYSPYSYSGYSPYRYGGNYGIVQSGYSSFGNYGGVYPSYYSGYNSSSFYRGSSYGNYGGYNRGWSGGRRR